MTNAEYRILDAREEALERELEYVRSQKREIAQRVFLSPAPAEALRLAEDNSRVPNGVPSELPVREPLILQSTLP